MAGTEETAKVASGVVDAMRNQPGYCEHQAQYRFFRNFYYVSRIPTRAEGTRKELFCGAGRLRQWGVIIKDTNELTEKSMHCNLS